MDEEHFNDGDGVVSDKWYEVEYNPATNSFRPKQKKKGMGANPPQKTDVGFFRVYQKNLRAIVMDKNYGKEPVKRVDENGKEVVEKIEADVYLTLPQLGLLTAMMAFAEWGTNRLVHPSTRQLLSISELSRLLGMNRHHVNEVADVLQDKGLISLKKQSAGMNKYIVINAQLMWFGKNMLTIPEQYGSFTDPAAECNYEPAVAVIYTEPKQR